MKEGIKNLKDRIFEIIQNPFLAEFATITENGKPWVRYIMAVGDKDFTIRFSTFSNSRKIKQINHNPEVHLTCGINDLTGMLPYIQVQGIAKIITSQEEKNNFWNDSLSKIFTGPTDPNYFVIVVNPYNIEYNQPNSFNPPEIWNKE